jgi:hypothetical protein
LIKKEKEKPTNQYATIEWHHHISSSSPIFYHHATASATQQLHDADAPGPSAPNTLHQYGRRCVLGEERVELAARLVPCPGYYELLAIKIVVSGKQISKKCRIRIK